MEQEAEVVVADAVVPNEAEAREAVQEAYDRIANPNQEPKTVEPEVPTAEEPPAPERSDEIEALKAQVARIPELEKRLRDEGGRYGALKQTIEQLQQKIAAPSTTAKESEAAKDDLDDALAEVRELFGDELYSSLKNAFARVSRTGKEMDPETLQKLVSEGINAAREEEEREAIDTLTELHPTWASDRNTPEFREWLNSMPNRERSHFLASKDPYFVAKNLDSFAEWKARQAAAAQPPQPTPQTSAQKAQPSKRLKAAVLPTNGTKPGTSPGDDKQAQVRAAYERAAGNRR